MSRFQCNLCDRLFASKFSMDRHRKSQHPEDQEMSGAETDESEEEMSATETDVDLSEEEMTGTDDEESAEELSSEDKVTDEDESPFDHLLRETYQTHDQEFEEGIIRYVNRGVDENEARDKAWRDLIPAYQKTFKKTLVKYLLRAERLKKDPIYRRVMQTIQSLREDEKFSRDEAIRAGVTRRKHLLYGLIASEPVTSESDED